MRGRITAIKRAKTGIKIAKGCGSGFGFIREAASGQDYFFPHGNVVGTPFDDLQEGLTVDFEPYEEPGRGWRARNVRVVA